MSSRVQTKALKGLPYTFVYFDGNGNGTSLDAPPNSVLRISANGTPVFLPTGDVVVVMAGVSANVDVLTDLPANVGIKFAVKLSTQSDDEAALENLTFFGKNKTPGVGFTAHVMSNAGPVFATLTLTWECF